MDRIPDKRMFGWAVTDDSADGGALEVHFLGKAGADLKILYRVRIGGECAVPLRLAWRAAPRVHALRAPASYRPDFGSSSANAPKRRRLGALLVNHACAGDAAPNT